MGTFEFNKEKALKPNLIRDYIVKSDSIDKNIDIKFINCLSHGGLDTIKFNRKGATIYNKISLLVLQGKFYNLTLDSSIYKIKNYQEFDQKLANNTFKEANVSDNFKMKNLASFKRNHYSCIRKWGKLYFFLPILLKQSLLILFVSMFVQLLINRVKFSGYYNMD